METTAHTPENAGSASPVGGEAAPIVHLGYTILLNVSPLNNNEGVMSRAEIWLEDEFIKSFNYKAGLRNATINAENRARRFINTLAAARPA